MKKSLFVIISFFIVQFAYSQENFQWDSVYISPKSKQILYSDIKMFVAKTWNSANDVIQNDDKENGQILIKGIENINGSTTFNPFKLTFNYTVVFSIKENKCRLEIKDVYCTKFIMGNYNRSSGFPLSEVYPGLNATAMGESKYFETTKKLKDALQIIETNFGVEINKPSSISTDW